MATTTTVVVLGVLSMIGFTVSAALPQGGDLPWKDIAGGGSTILMLAALVVILRHLATDRATQVTERSAMQTHVETVTKAAQTHVETVTEKFSETATNLFRENREDNQQARKELQDLVRELKRATS